MNYDEIAIVKQLSDYLTNSRNNEDNTEKSDKPH